MTTDYPMMKRVAGLQSDWELFNFNKYLDNLKRRGYIRARQFRGKKIICLTNQGKKEILKYKIRLKGEGLKWNGKWHAICWDVPETFKKNRDYLRRQLRWLGFKELQKSIWIFPFDVKKEVKEIFRLYKENLEGDVRFLTITKIEDDRDILKYFKLS